MGKQAKFDLIVEQETLDRLKAQAESLTGIDRELAQPLLMEAGAMMTMLTELRATVLEEGVLIEVVKGGANNRHTEKVENPALTAYSKLVGRFGDLCKKISSFFKGTNDDGEKDELIEFISKR